jgi:hypothetical protein
MVTISDVLAKILYDIAAKDPAKQEARLAILRDMGIEPPETTPETSPRRSKTMQPLTTHPKNTQRPSGGALTQNDHHFIAKVKPMFDQYEDSMALFESPATWAAYVLVRITNQIATQPNGE